MKTQTTHRLGFELTEETLAEIDALCVEAGFATRAELMRHALRFFQWAFDETQKNKATLLLERDGKIREVLFLFWLEKQGKESPNERT